MKKYTNKVCIYHGNCLDGFTAAYIVARAYPGVELVEGKYHEEIDLSKLVEKDVIFVDFSTKHDEMAEIARVAKSVLILDHHVSAERELSGLDEEFDNVEIVFDMNRSGAMIAWEYFNDTPAPRIVSIVQDRDLWRFEDEHTNAVTAYMRTLDQTLDEWEALFHGSVLRYTEIGSTLVEQHTKNAKALIDATAHEAIVDGNKVLVANIPFLFASEAGHLMVKEGYPFSVTYFITKDGEYSYSFRADGEYDVSKLAQSLGGGGHPNASGATTSKKIWKEL